MVITNNISALRVNNYIAQMNKQKEQSIKMLSSGYRINQAADDAAGLAISEKMRAQIRGLNQASKNAEDGISLLQTAEGGLNEIHSILQRMRELSVQAANDTNTESDRNHIQLEISQLTQEVNRVAGTTEFNTIKLLDGTIAGAFYTAGSGGTGGGGSAPIGDTFKQKIDWTGGSFWLNHEQGISISYFDGTSNQTIELKAVNSGWNYKDGIVIAPAGGGNLKDMIDMFNTAISHPSNLGGKLEHFLDRFTMSTDPANDHILTLTAKGSNFKINSITCLAGSPISNGGPLETVSGAGTLNTEAGGGLVLQIGASSGQIMNIAIDKIDSAGLGITELNVLSHDNASDALGRLDTAINHVSGNRSRLGAYQNRLEAVIRSLDNTAENLTDAESRIRDTNMADEMVAYSKSNLLNQTAQAMLVQANQLPSQALALLN